MNIAEAKSRYLDAGKFFEPDYQRDHEALASFREANPTLSEEQTRDLTEILRRISGNTEYEHLLYEQLRWLKSQ